MFKLNLEDADVEYDPKADAAYIRLRRAKHGRTIEISDAVNVDVDASGRLIGVELLFVKEAYAEIAPVLKKLAAKYHAPALKHINPAALAQVYAAA